MSGLFGSYYVTPTASAQRRAWKLCSDHASDYFKIREHTLKLAFWPDDIDLDWDWIRSLERKHIGELRIGEVIAGYNNLRVIFFKAEWTMRDEPLPRIWPLTVFQKKRNDFSTAELRTFEGARDVVVTRHYSDT